MRVSLVMPSFDLASSLGGGVKARRGMLPPLGVGYLASALEAHGHEVSFVDACLLGLDTADTASMVLADEPDLVGISCLTRMADSAYALATEIKGRDPNIPVVLGGPHATSFYAEILDACPEVDVVVPGEGELVFAELVNRLENRGTLDGVAGILYRDDSGRTVTTPNAELVKDLDALPHPARHVYRNDLYAPLPNQRRRTPATTAITARGCPYGKCRFCYQGGRYGACYRRRSPDNVVDELRHLVRDLGYREIVFQDDSFCAGTRWINEFCDRLDEEKLDVTWTVQARVDTVTPTLLKRMAAAGCYNVYFGFESGNQELLDLIRKGITLEQSRNAVRWAKEAGIEVRGSFILGLPTETPEMGEQSIRFACELDVEYMLFFPYHVQRGTALEEIALREGTLLEEQLDIHAPAYLPNGYSSAEQLSNLVKSAYRRYYMRPKYIARALWRARKPVVLRNYIESFIYWLGLMGPKRARATHPPAHADSI